MTEKLFRPDKAYWKEVAKFDETLFARGRRNRSTSIGKVADQRVLFWRHDEQDFSFESVQFSSWLPVPLGSRLLRVEEICKWWRRRFRSNSIIA